jgi:hypothetical protein
LVLIQLNLMAVLVAKAKVSDALSELPLRHLDRKARQALRDLQELNFSYCAHISLHPPLW